MDQWEADKVQAALQAHGCHAIIVNPDPHVDELPEVSYTIEARDHNGLLCIFDDRVQALNWLIRYWLPGEGE